MKNKLPEIGKRYRRKYSHTTVIVSAINNKVIITFDTNIIDLYRHYDSPEEFWEIFEELPNQKLTIDHIVDANKKGVNEALEDYKKEFIIFFRSKICMMETTLTERDILTKEFKWFLECSTENLVNTLETQIKSENLYTKEEHVKKTEKSLHEEERIYKVILR